MIYAPRASHRFYPSSKKITKSDLLKKGKGKRNTGAWSAIRVEAGKSWIPGAAQSCGCRTAQLLLNLQGVELFWRRHGRVAQQRYFTEGRTEPDPDFGNAVKSYLPGLILIATLGDKCCDKDYTFEILRYNLFAPWTMLSALERSTGGARGKRTWKSEILTDYGDKLSKSSTSFHTALDKYGCYKALKAFKLA